MDFKQHKNNNIYIIESYNNIGDSIIKIGYTENIEKRLQVYYYHNPYINVIDTCYLSNAKQWEIDFHKNNKSIILNEWYDKSYLNIILNDLIDNNAIFDKTIIDLEKEFNNEELILNNPNIKTWILIKLRKQEYSYDELEEIFTEDFKNKGLVFNGYTIKDYFPPFEKIRRVKNKIKKTYYKFKI